MQSCLHSSSRSKKLEFDQEMSSSVKRGPRSIGKKVFRRRKWDHDFRNDTIHVFSRSAEFDRYRFWIRCRTGFHRRKATRPLDHRFPGDDGFNQRHRFYVTGSSLHALACHRHYFSARAGTRDLCALRSSPRGSVAAGFCNHGEYRPISKLLCIDRAAVHEGSGTESSRANSIRISVQSHSVDYVGRVRVADDSCGHQVSRWRDTQSLTSRTFHSVRPTLQFATGSLFSFAWTTITSARFPPAKVSLTYLPVAESLWPKLTLAQNKYWASRPRFEPAGF